MPNNNKTITVYYTKNKSNHLSVDTTNRHPYTNEWIKLNIETDDDYTDKVYFSKLQYRSSNSSSWSNISRTSSTYVSDYSSDWVNEYYKMTSSDRGEVTLKNLVKFKKSGYISRAKIKERKESHCGHYRSAYSVLRLIFWDYS